MHPIGVPALDALAAELDLVWGRIAEQATGQEDRCGGWLEVGHAGGTE